MSLARKKRWRVVLFFNVEFFDTGTIWGLWWLRTAMQLRIMLVQSIKFGLRPGFAHFHNCLWIQARHLKPRIQWTLRCSDGDCSGVDLDSELNPKLSYIGSRIVLSTFISGSLSPNACFSCSPIVLSIGSHAV